MVHILLDSNRSGIKPGALQSDISDHYVGFEAAYGHVVAIVDSVRASDRSEDLAAFTSVFDLMVVLPSAREAPYDVIAVRSPRSGNVLIEHLSPSGRNDRIERPAAEAVPLFWRFVIEKFGLTPQH